MLSICRCSLSLSVSLSLCSCRPIVISHVHALSFLSSPPLSVTGALLSIRSLLSSSSLWIPPAALFLSISISAPSLSPPRLLSFMDPPSSVLLSPHDLSLTLFLSDWPHANVFVDSPSDRERPLESVPTANGSIVSGTSRTVLVLAFISSVCLCVCVCVEGTTGCVMFLYIYFFNATHNIIYMHVCAWVHASVDNAGLLITLNDWWQRGHGSMELTQAHTEERTEPDPSCVYNRHSASNTQSRSFIYSLQFVGSLSCGKILVKPTLHPLQCEKCEAAKNE